MIDEAVFQASRAKPVKTPGVDEESTLEGTPDAMVKKNVQQLFFEDPL